MIFPTINYQIKFKRQEGITLLLSILILSAVLAISFSIATILFVEIRTSGDLVRTEGAIYAAEGVSEEAFFKLKRKVGSSFVYSGQLGQVTVNTPIESTTTPLVYETVLSCANNTFATAARLPIYNTDLPNVGSDYGKIKLENFGDATVQVWLCEYNPNGINIIGNPYASSLCSNQDSNEYWIDISENIVSAAPGDYSAKQQSIVQASSREWLLNVNRQQEVVMLVPVCTAPVMVKLTGFAADRATQKPLPLVGETSVIIRADAAGVSRRLQLKIPKE